MAKYCTNCGQELRDADTFCVECGNAAQEPATQVSPVLYEHCEIETRIVRTYGFPESIHAIRRFYAAVSSPTKGNYRAAFKTVDWANEFGVNRSLPSGNVALAHMVQLLTADGWELLSTRGKDWFSYKFRRPVKG